jgi:hypothetical protein
LPIHNIQQLPFPNKWGEDLEKTDKYLEISSVVLESL